MVATLTTSLICNSFEAFEFTGTFGLFSNKHSYFVYVDVAMDSQLKMFLPVVVLGVLGGFAGVAFTWLNLKICGWRNRWIACKPWQRVMEVSILAVVTASVCVFLPTAFECLPVDCAAVPDRVGCTSRLRQSGMESGEVLHQFTCPVRRTCAETVLSFSVGLLPLCLLHLALTLVDNTPLHIHRTVSSTQVLLSFSRPQKPRSNAFSAEIRIFSSTTDL
jgi:H+/Cl- antiporter ClcA